jgi:hypothetical protein
MAIRRRAARDAERANDLGQRTPVRNVAVKVRLRCNPPSAAATAEVTLIRYVWVAASRVSGVRVTVRVEAL